LEAGIPTQRGRIVPIFEYRCTACNHRFETIAHGSAPASCPHCAATTLERQLSVFAVGTAGARPAPTVPRPCHACGDPRGPGACSMN
jgi:putative FmdB family regulatory protein